MIRPAVTTKLATCSSITTAAIMVIAVRMIDAYVSMQMGRILRRLLLRRLLLLPRLLVRSGSENDRSDCIYIACMRV